MRASYKNTSVALLVTFALSLFFGYAMKPNKVAGSVAGLPAAELMKSSSVNVTLESVEEAGPGNFNVHDDDDFEIVLTSQ
jgi:hypothetical protein